MISLEVLSSGISSTLVFVAVLSILIVVHEWGHFITAKLLGIRVDEFALGFGPTLWAKKYNGTNYMLKLYPLGGYVRMAGDERAKCTGSKDEFFSKTPFARALVVFNGPLVNFVLAYVCLVLVFMLGYPGVSTKIAEIIPGGPAEISDIQQNDRIIAINDKKIYGWMHLDRLLQGDSVEPIKITVDRDGALIESTVTPVVEIKKDLLQIPTSYRSIGLGFAPNILGYIEVGAPADKAGLQMEDRVIEVDSKLVTNWTTLHKAVSTAENEVINVKFMRGDELITMDIVSDSKVIKDEDGNEKTVRRLGIGPMQDLSSYKFSFTDSLKYSFEELSYITVLTYEALYRMVTGSVKPKDSVTGPVGIFYIVKGAAEAGITHLLFILGVISASLAIFNLLPMLPLDGGHLTLLAIEQVRGKPMPEKFDEFVAKVGFTFIILLALFVFYNDFAQFGLIDGIKSFFSKLFN